MNGRGGPSSPMGGGGWAYVSIVSTLPGVDIDTRVALAAQVLLFEGAAVALAAWYGLWDALPVATVAVGVATAGSGLMVSLTDRIRRLQPPEPYRHVLFDSSIDVMMGTVAFVALVTYLFVTGGGPGSGGPGGGLLTRLLGDRPPAPAVFLGLLVAWDLCYRIGTGWWASVTGLWRAVRFAPGMAQATRQGYVRADLLTIAFAGLQALLVPFLWADRPLALLVLGHVAAVVVVSSLAIGLTRRG